MTGFSSTTTLWQWHKIEFLVYHARLSGNQNQTYYQSVLFLQERP